MRDDQTAGSAAGSPSLLLFSATDTGSRRSVIVSRETDAVWCYLTAPGSMTPVADCWLLNLVDAPDSLHAYQHINGVPPATARFTSQPAAMAQPDTEDFSALWSQNGEAVAIAVRNRVLAYLQSTTTHGYCRYLLQAGPYGNPFDPERFTLLFPGV